MLQAAVPPGERRVALVVGNGRYAAEKDVLTNPPSDAIKIADIPGVIVQGRYDVITPPDTAWQLHKAWPKARFEMIDDAGHAGSEPGTVDALIRATNSFI